MSHEMTERRVLDNFKANVIGILHSQNLTEKELSVRAGFTEENAVTTLLSGSTLPNFSAPMKLADALGVPLETLLRDRDAHLQTDFNALPVQKVNHEAARLLNAVFRATERAVDGVTDRPSLDSVIAWWKETDGDLSVSEQILPHFDLVRAAEALSAIPTVDHVGALGLSATTLGSAENDRLRYFLRTLSTSDIEELNGNIQTVARTGVGMITPQTRKVPFAATNETLEVSFVRLMLPVKDTDGTLFVLNYSTLLSESAPRKLHG